MPFHRFRRADGSAIDSLLGPEMKSTGEVMGIDRDFGSAFAKSQTAAYGSLPAERHRIRLGRQPRQAIAGVPGQAAGRPGLPRSCYRGHRGNVAPQRDSLRRGSQALRATAAGPPRGSAVDAIKAGEVDMVINTPYGNSGPRIDGYEIRSAAVVRQHPLHHDGAGRVGRRAGHRGGDPRRHRRAVAAGTAQPSGSAPGESVPSSDRVRRPAGRGEGESRAAVPGHRPASRAAAGVGPADHRRRPGRVLRHLRRGVLRFRRRQTPGGVLRGLRVRRIRGAGTHHRRAARRPGCWCWPTPSGATSGRRWRPTPPPGRATRRWPPTP